MLQPSKTTNSLADSDPVLPTRLRAGSLGLGAASQTEIEGRAAELAASDGRDSFTDADLAVAAVEMGGGPALPSALEADFALEQVTVWDAPPDQTGHRVERTTTEGEDNIGEGLIEDGLSEADHDIRVAAAEAEIAKTL